MDHSNEHYDILKKMKENKKAPLCMNIIKQIYNQKTGTFASFARILSGSVCEGQKVRVLGQKFSPFD